MKRPIKICAYSALGILIAAIVLVIGCNVWFVAHYDGVTYDNVDEVPYRPYCLLLATSPVQEDGTRSEDFDNLIKAAEELYKAKKVEIFIVSGKDYTGIRRNGCDEPTAIRNSMTYGLSDVVVLDNDGERTITSIIKTKECYKCVDTVLVLSQKGETQRALYLAKHYGLPAVGYNVPSPHSRSIKDKMCEYLARVRMFFDICREKILPFTPKDTDVNNLMYNANISVDIKYANSVRVHNEQDTIVGNFTGHGLDTLYVDVVEHPNETDILECEDFYAKSTNLKIPTLSIEGCSLSHPKLVYEGDLDGNGTDEWGYLVTGVNSQWRYYYVFTLVDGKWRHLYYGHDDYPNILWTNESIRMSGVDIVQKGPKKGYIRILYSSEEFSNPGIHDTIVAATYTEIKKEYDR